MEKIKSIAILALVAIIVLFCFRYCTGDTSRSSRVIVKKDTVTVVDYTTVIDTVNFPDTIIITKPVYVPRIDTVYVQEDGTQIKKFSSEVKDSLIEGTIHTEIKNDTILWKQWFDYTPLFPKYIIKKDSVTVTNTITKTVYEEPTRLIVGGHVSMGNNQYFAISPEVGIRIKGIEATLHYDLINRAPGFGLTVPIRFKR